MFASNVLRGSWRLRVVLGSLAGSGVVATACDGDQTPTPTDAVHCPGTVVGDPTAAAQLTIVEARNELGDIFARGVANNVDAAQARVVLWAKTDIWYVQPFVNDPFTVICSDGTWRSTIHPWDRVVALLVGQAYEPGTIRFTHPGDDPGVLAWDERPERRPDRVVDFSGYAWRVKRTDVPAGPGPNLFSDSESHIWVEDDELNLMIGQREDGWYSTEVFLERSLGHGVYTFQTTTDMTALGPNTVAAGFLYEALNREIDVEFSKALIAAPAVGQYVVQPHTRPGKLRHFQMNGEDTTHRIEWRADRIEFTSWNGFGPYPPNNAELIDSWTYMGPDIPPPGAERFRFNLWLFDGTPPLDGLEDAFVITSFDHDP